MIRTLFDLPPASLTYEEWARIGHANGWLGVRTGDGSTSRAPLPNLSVRAGSQRHKLLQQYGAAPYGLTDEQAGQMSGLADLPRCCYWKRCSELRQAGYIAATGITRASSAGEAQQVCTITETGRAALDSLDA